MTVRKKRQFHSKVYEQEGQRLLKQMWPGVAYARAELGTMLGLDIKQHGQHGRTASGRLSIILNLLVQYDEIVPINRHGYQRPQEYKRKDCTYEPNSTRATASSADG